ncbi:integrase core domain-containing protein [Lentzea sp. BCCO 10_0798]|uniref:Integrase core domain-containing protein n=1 Tax=Lentzea kristufekii TaxID=3095430 RepID=A0ABU4U6J1_9PSEU|nr:integrase core domain-containing protein [Lentzea sp. BCCO 10_0798]MDX8056195.1 integrase core domain-containing protein [Lentzea sp. BCCO 10_0798]
MLVRFAYLAVTHAFAALRLLPLTDREKDVEILALRHQLTVLQRQLGDRRPQLRPEDRAFLAALLTPLARATLRRLRLLVSPDTVLRWHRDLVKRRHAQASRRRRRGRPRTVASIRRLVLRLAAENSSWGYRRIHGELALLGVTVAPSTVWEILKAAGIDTAPHRPTVTWAEFLRSQAEVVLAMDFIETVTLTGARQYILAAVHHAGRRVRILGTTAHPTHAWVTQAVRNLLMHIEDAGSLARVRFLIHDRDGKYPALIDDILSGAGITTILTGVRVPRMNAIMERWGKTLRGELLDRTLIWNDAHLRHALQAYEQHYNQHRTHRSLAAAAPLRARPQPLGPDRIERLAVLRRDRLGGVLHEYRHAA